MPASDGFRMSLGILSAVSLIFCMHAASAQEAPAAPRTPMGPGSSWLGNRVGDIGIVPYSGRAQSYIMAPTMAPPHLRGLVPSTQRRAGGAGPDLAALEADAINVLRDKKADVVVLSKANANLILQLYRPEQNQWQEYQLAPLTMTSIVCQPCNGTLRFAFNDGTRQLEMNVEVPSLLRVFPDQSGSQWRWDSFKLVFASTPEQPSQ